MTRRNAWPLLVLLAAGGCRDAAAPLDRTNAAGSPLAMARPSSDGTHILQQSPTAPPLQDYRVSFWAYVGRASTLTVNYQPVAGQSVGDSFLRFAIPKNGLQAGAGGMPLRRGDSVLVRLTIDSLEFVTHFDPSGVQFSNQFPASLTVWYENANPDVNGDGMVTGKDKQLLQQLSFWYHGRIWSQVSSQNDTTASSVATDLYHFSSYAVLW